MPVLNARGAQVGYLDDAKIIARAALADTKEGA
jgi:hypothetical protein